MAISPREERLKEKVAFSPEEKEYNQRVEQDPVNLQMLNEQIARTKDPESRAILEKEKATLLGSATDVRDYRAQYGHGIPGGGEGEAAVPSVDVADILTTSQEMYQAAIEASRATRAATRQIYLESGARVGAIASEAVNAVEANARAKAAKELETARLEIEQQVHNDTIARAVGLNRDAQATRVAATASVVDRYRAQRAEMLDEIGQRQGVGFFDNPLLWIANQTVLPGLIERHNAVVDKEIAATRNLEKDSALVQDQFKLAAGTAASTNAEIAQANADALIAQARIDASRLRRDDEVFRAQIAGHINALAHQEVTELHGVAEMELRKTEATERRMERSEDREILRKLREQQLKDLTDKEKAEVKLLTELKDLSVRSGNIDLTPDRIRLMAKQDQDLISSAMSSNGRFGTSVEDALRYFVRFGAPQRMLNKSAEIGQWSAAHGAAYEKLYRQNQERAKTDPKLFGKKDEELQILAAKDYVSILERQSVDVGLVDKNSPYVANHERLLIDPLLKNNIMNAAYTSIKGTVTNPNSITDLQLLKWAVAEAAKNKVSLPQLSTDISAYYKAATEYNNLHRGLTLFNLPLQKQYNWGLEGNIFIPRQVFDLSNPARVSNMVTLMIARDRANAMTGGKSGGFSSAIIANPE